MTPERSVSGGRVGRHRRSMSNTGSIVQGHREYNLLLHSTGSDAADLRPDCKIARPGASKYRELNDHPVFGVAGRESGRLDRRLVQNSITLVLPPSFYSSTERFTLN